MPEPTAARPVRARLSASERQTGNAARRRRTRTIVVGAVLAVLGALVVYHRLFLADGLRHHEYAIEWPVAAPRGEPIAIAASPKAGEAFRTRYDSHFRIVLSVDPKVDPRQGMNLDVALLATHQVRATGEGPSAGLESTYRVSVDTAKSTPAELAQKVQSAIGAGAPPYVLHRPRDVSGVPNAPLRFGPFAGLQRKAVDVVLYGLGDVTATYLPARPVRLGDVWDLEESAPFPGILDVVRFVARTDEAPGGYPPATVVAKVAAEALETRREEACLRCRVVVYVTQEGDAKPPALAGRISTAARLDGHVWISTRHGIPWETDLACEITTSYLSARPTERRAAATLTARTEAIEPLPD